VTPEIARLRIAGRQFEDLLGMDPRGMPLGVYFSLDARDELALALSQVSQGGRAQLPLRGESGLGKPGLDGLLLLLPLTDGQGRITRVLGVLETHGQNCRTCACRTCAGPRTRRATAADRDQGRPQGLEGRKGWRRRNGVRQPQPYSTSARRSNAPTTRRIASSKTTPMIFCNSALRNSKSTKNRTSQPPPGRSATSQ
jgi:hypothetical protein